MSDSLWLHGLQQARTPCPSLSPGVCSGSCPLSRWCHPTLSSSATIFSFCPQSFPASWSFPMSQPLASGGQSIGASTSTAVLPVDIQGWFLLGLSAGLIYLQSKRLSRFFSTSTVLNAKLKHFRLLSWPRMWDVLVEKLVPIPGSGTHHAQEIDSPCIHASIIAYGMNTGKWGSWAIHISIPLPMTSCHVTNLPPSFVEDLWKDSD